MFSTARAVISISLLSLPGAALAQAGPSEAQIIAGAPTSKINVGAKKLAGQMVATLRVGDDGLVKDLTVTENTAESAFEPQLTKVLQNTRFRPAIDANGQAVESTVDVKVELRPSTGALPKPVAAKPDPQLTEKEKVRIRKMKCSDFVWEWKILDDEAGAAAATEFMPRIAVTMYAAMRTEAGEYVDAKIWKASAKALKEAADRCDDSPTARFWDGVFKNVPDEAVPKSARLSPSNESLISTGVSSSFCTCTHCRSAGSPRPTRMVCRPSRASISTLSKVTSSRC